MSLFPLLFVYICVSNFLIRCSVFLPGVPANVDARLTDNSEEALVASLKSLTLRDTDLPTRPGFGTSGTQIKLRTNFFPVRVPKGPLHEYDVAITPATAIKRIKRRIFQLAEQTTDWANAGMVGRVAHDHSTKLISSFKLPQPLVVKVMYTDEDEDEDKKREKETPAPAAARPPT